MRACRHRLGPDQRQPSPGPAPPPAPMPPAMPRCRPCLAPLPAPLGLRFRALFGLGFVPPPEPRSCVHCASIAYALLPAARVPLCRHRADPESSSRSLPSGSPARIAPIAPTVRRRPHRAHRAPTSASPPPSLSSRCGGPRALAGKNRAVCIPFSPNARKRPSSWQHPLEMHAFRDQDGNILAPCIHFRAQSGDSGYMARESCRQGPTFASRNPKSRMTRRCCQRRAAFPRQRPAVRPNGLCAMRQWHAARGMAERALRPAARAWPACRMRAPCHLACARRRPRSSPPSYTRRASPPASRPPRAAIRRAAHCGRDELSIGLFLPPSCCPRRRIASTDARSPAPPEPNPRQPSPGPEPTESRPPMEPPAPTRAPPPRLTLPRGSRCGSGNSREMMR